MNHGASPSLSSNPRRQSYLTNPTPNSVAAVDSDDSGGGIVLTSTLEAPSTLENQLSSLAKGFQGFEQEIQHNKLRKRDDDEKRILELKTELVQVRKALALETKRRKETTKALETMFETNLTALKSDVENGVHTKLDELLTDVRAVTEHVGKLEKELEADRIAFPKMVDDRSDALTKQLNDFKMVDDRSDALTKQLNDFKAKFEAARDTREAKEQDILSNISEQAADVQKQVESERFFRESKVKHLCDNLHAEFFREKKVKHLCDELDAEVRIRRKGMDNTRTYLNDQLTTLKNQLVAVTEERERSTDEVLKAFVHYTAALQDGVKIVSKS